MIYELKGGDRVINAKAQPKAEITADYADYTDFIFFIRVIRVIRG